MSIEVKSDLKYTKEDEWIKIEGEIATVGITDYAQDALSDIVYLELPNVGDTFEIEDEFGVVESVKAASDLYMPLDGEITAVNEALLDAPEAINEKPFDSWMIKFKITNPDQIDDLMDAEAYTAYCADR
mgnify:CR=1 FL=1